MNKINSAFEKKLMSQGYVFIPKLKFDRYKNVRVSPNKHGHIQNFSDHLLYFEEANIKKYLLPKLLKFSKKIFSKKIDANDLYFVTRIAANDEKTRSDFGHFDSHIFTLITPVKIPRLCSGEFQGQLTIFNKIRKEPKSEIVNFFEKLYFFLFYSNEKGIKRLKIKKRFVVFDFQNYTPLLFMGRQSFHVTQKFQSKISNQKHILFITHFFNPSPIFSIGRLNKFLRGLFQQK